MKICESELNDRYYAPKLTYVKIHKSQYFKLIFLLHSINFLFKLRVLITVTIEWSMNIFSLRYTSER
jgi:hypothetical protein